LLCLRGQVHVESCKHLTIQREHAIIQANLKNNSVKVLKRMDQLSESLVTQKIALEQVVREEYELLILRSLMETSLGVLWGSKAAPRLRLAYGSPDPMIDFSLSTHGGEDVFARAAETVAEVASGQPG